MATEFGDGLTNQPVVIDNGSGTIKAGFAGQDTPKCFFPTSVGRPKHTRAMAGAVEGDQFIGRKAQELRGLLRIRYPMEHGLVTDWADMERIWNYIYTEELKTLPEEHPVLLTEAPLNSRANREAAAQIFFETFNVPAMYVSIQALLSLYSSGRTTGVVLDSGDGVTHAVPVYEGFAMPHAIRRIDVAGRDVTEHLQMLLRRSGYYFHTSAEKEIVRAIKEQCCQLDTQGSSGEAKQPVEFTLPDGNLIKLGHERFRAPEALFRPEIIGHEDVGAHQVLMDAIGRADLDLRRQLYGNIVLSGGTTLTKGYGERLLYETKHLAPPDMKIKISAPPERNHSQRTGMAVPHAAHAKENGEAPSEDSSGPQELDAYSDLVDLATLDTSRQYTIIRRSGSGAFGEVYIADWHSPMPTGAMVPAMQHSYTRPAYVGKRIVAIKRCRVATALTQGSTLLNELHALRKIPAHPNTIALYDIFRENNKLHIVFECMEGNLYQLIKSRKGLPMAPGLVASVADQMFRGIAHVHKHGFFHRDMKPENVLITTLGVGEYPLPGTSITRQDVLVLAKVADFGLARSLDSKSPYSGYISTRWYRAPEVLLRSPTYAAPIDVWALAAITAEMVMLEPLFPGANELDQLNCIIRVLGTLGDAPQPPKQRRALHVGGGTWKEAQVLAERLQIQLPGGPGVPFESLFASKTYPMLVDLLFMMLRYDPHLRYTMSQCLQHPFFTEQMAQFRPIRCMMPGKGHAEPAPPEASDGQNLSDHDSPAMSMESDEGFLEMRHLELAQEP
ncbi:centractin- actin- protein of the dynactin complex [Malassezia caprae]|uniref:Centractin n=1 Tax=Malassezia caprae TaxID=1381934 RepID=A0AAF0J0K6_9BASI|nr:centractin- actin- protein of the dynactin complex [Malassezia caprae]